MSSSNTLKLVAVGLVLTAVLLSIKLTRSNSARIFDQEALISLDRTSHVQSSSRTPSEAPTGPDEIRRPLSIPDVEHILVQGAAICETTGAPLSARITCGEDSTISDRLDGTFSIMATKNCTHLTITHCTGYADKVVLLDKGDASKDGVIHLGAIPLSPLAHTRVYVRNLANQPVAHAEISALKSSHKRLGRALGKTDFKGELLISVGGPVVLSARRRDEISTSVPCSPGDRSVVLTLQSKATLRLVAIDTLAPIGNIELVVRQVGVFPEVVLEGRTNEDGVLSQPLWTGAFTVASSMRQVRIQKTSVDEVRPGINYPGAPVAFEVSLPGEIQTLYARQDTGPVLKVLDASSREFIPEINLSARWYKSSENRWFESTSTACKTVNGECAMGWLELNPDNYVRVSVQGYHDNVFSIMDLTSSVPGPYEIHLSRQSERSIRVLKTDGSPLRQPVFVWSTSGNGKRTLIGERTPRPDGTLDAFAWPGNSIDLSRGRKSSSIAHVPSEVFLEYDIPTVYTDSLGSIQVEVPAGEDPALACISCAGDLFAARIVQNVWYWDELPEGYYEVGPEGELETLRIRKGSGFEACGLFLKAGQTIQTTWNDTWGSCDAWAPLNWIDDASEERQRIAFPIYGPLDLPRNINITLDNTPCVLSDGTLSMHIPSGRPTGIVIGAIGRHGGFSPVGFIPGWCGELEVPIRLQSTAIILSTAATAVDGLYEVSYLPDFDLSLSFPVTRIGRLGQDLVIDAVPVGVTSLKLRSKKLREGEVNLDLVLSPNRSTYLDLSGLSWVRQ